MLIQSTTILTKNYLISLNVFWIWWGRRGEGVRRSVYVLVFIFLVTFFVSHHQKTPPAF